MFHDTDKKLNVDIVEGYQYNPLPPLKINMSLKQVPFQEEISFSNDWFQGMC